MSEYTPTTGEVRHLYRMGKRLGDRGSKTPARDAAQALGIAEFDRWLNSVKADAWSEGWHDCGDTSLHYTDNPYLTEGTN